MAIISALPYGGGGGGIPAKIALTPLWEGKVIQGQVIPVANVGNYQFIIVNIGSFGTMIARKTGSVWRGSAIYANNTSGGHVTVFVQLSDRPSGITVDNLTYVMHYPDGSHSGQFAWQNGITGIYAVTVTGDVAAVANKKWTTIWTGNITSGSITIPGISVDDELLVVTNVGTFPLFFSGTRAIGFGGTKNTANASMYLTSIAMDLSGNTLTVRPESTGYLQVLNTGGAPTSGTPNIVTIQRKQ